LIRENNQAGNFTHTWTYDNAGNILERKEYAYTTGSLEGVTPVNTVSYTYGDSQWGDLLTAYDGNTITYDEIGNPLYDGEWIYTWQHGRQLASMRKGAAAAWYYTYDANGMRTQRTNGSTTYSYIYDGSLLSQMTVAGHTLSFSYDANGTPLTVTFDGTTYYYVTNLQGDVTTILTQARNPVANYTYDAWGNIVAISGSLATTLGRYNPLLYRGYVYDSETQLYYLQSRYYNPEIGRFLNADGLVSTGQGMLGNNMFAYCGNNPANRIDYTGQLWAEIWEGITEVAKEVGKALGGAAPVYAACGSAALADGPLPFGDFIAGASITFITIGVIGHEIYRSTKTAASISRAKEKEKATTVTKRPDRSVYFPENPDDFNPVGLIKKVRPGTTNGIIINWLDPVMGKEVFRWDQNINYSNGPHYHIHGEENCHYYPEDTVPEPYATIFFPLK